MIYRLGLWRCVRPATGVVRPYAGASAPYVWIGWSGLLVGLALWIVGPEIGVALALTWISPIAGIAIVPFMERGTARKSATRAVVLAPSDRVSKAWRSPSEAIIFACLEHVAYCGL